MIIKKNNNLTLPRWAEENYDLIVGTGSYGFYFDFRFTEIGKLVSGKSSISFEFQLKCLLHSEYHVSTGGILREMRKNILNKTMSTNSIRELHLFSGVSIDTRSSEVDDL